MSTSEEVSAAVDVPDTAGPQGPSFGRALLDAIIQGSSTVVTVLAIVTAIVLGGLLIAFSSKPVLHKWSNFFSAPGAAVAAAWHLASAAYTALFDGAIINPATVSAAFHGGSIAAIFYPLSESIVQATPLIFGGLAVTLAFRAGLFNIGVQGQFIGGALIAGYLAFGVSMPPVIHVIVAVLGGFAGGAAVGWLVGWLKARTGAHEVIVTIMLNYVAQYGLLYLLGTSLFQEPSRAAPLSPTVPGDARLPHLAVYPPLRIHAGILVALAAAFGVWWLLSRSTLGFEFRAVGANPDAARSAGMSVGKVYILVMLIAGGLAGLAGANVLLGTDYQLTPVSYGTYGVDSITVALLGRASPFGTVLAALLYGALHAGSVNMQASLQIPVDITTVIQSLIVLFIAAPPLVRAIYRLRGARRGGAGESLAKGWNG